MYVEKIIESEGVQYRVVVKIDNHDYNVDCVWLSDILGNRLYILERDNISVLEITKHFLTPKDAAIFVLERYRQEQKMDMSMNDRVKEFEEWDGSI